MSTDVYKLANASLMKYALIQFSLHDFVITALANDTDIVLASVYSDFLALVSNLEL